MVATLRPLAKSVELSVYHKYFWNLLFLNDIVASGLVHGSAEHVMKLYSTRRIFFSFLGESCFLHQKDTYPLIYFSAGRKGFML